MLCYVIVFIANKIAALVIWQTAIALWLNWPVGSMTRVQHHYLVDKTLIDSDDDFRTGRRNVSHCQRQQQSYSGPRSPGSSVCDKRRVQTCKRPYFTSSWNDSWAELFKAGLRSRWVSTKFDFSRFKSLKSKFSLILFCLRCWSYW